MADRRRREPEPAAVEGGRAASELPGLDGPSVDLLEALVGHFSGGVPAGEISPDALERLGPELAESGVLRAELGAFWTLLGTGLAQAGYRRPCGAEVRLLNLACGPCVEAPVLTSFFGLPGVVGGARNRVRHYGIDLREREVDNAGRRYAATEAAFQAAGVPTVREEGDEGDTVEFLTGDATRLDGIRQVPRTFEVVFIRHQNAWNDLPAWRRIFAFALERLAQPGGVLVVTSYFDREHLIALREIKQLGAKVEASLANPQRVPLDHPDKSADRHLAVVTRAPRSESGAGS